MIVGLAAEEFDEFVATADFRVLPGGTAYITDVGMTGPLASVIGIRKEVALELSARGYSNVEVLVNGLSVWQDAGLPTETTP